MNDALIGRPFICTECKTTFIVEAPPHCPKCGGELPADAVLCVGCGYHLQRGETLEEAHAAPPPPPERVPRTVRMLMAVHDTAPGLFRPLNAAMFVLFVALAAGTAYLAMVMAGLGLFFETLYIGTFAMFIYAQGAAFLFVPKLENLKSALVDIEGDAWWIYLVVLFLPAIIFFCVISHLARHAGAG